MKRLTIYVLALILLTATSFYAAPALYAGDVDEVFDEFRESMEELTEGIAKKDWNDISKSTKSIAKQAREIAGMDVGKKNKLFKVEAEWLVSQADELISLAKKKNLAELIWDYGALYARYQGVLSTVPEWAIDEFAEGIKELQEAAEEKNKEEAPEAAERIDEGGRQLTMAAHMMRESFANTRWERDIQKIVPVEHAVIEAIDSGDWDKVEKLASAAEKLQKKVKLSMK